MKTTKRVLCILLAFALCVGLCVTAAAWFTSPPNSPYAPVITVAPDYPESISVGDTLSVEVEAVLPDGVEGELSYAWYNGDWYRDISTSPIATGSELEIVITKEMVQSGSHGSDVYITVVVANTYEDENGETQTAYTAERHFLSLSPAQWWQTALFVLFLLIAVPISAPLMLLLGPFALVLGPSFLLVPVRWILDLFGLDFPV